MWYRIIFLLLWVATVIVCDSLSMLEDLSDLIHDLAMSTLRLLGDQCAMI